MNSIIYILNYNNISFIIDEYFNSKEYSIYINNRLFIGFTGSLLRPTSLSSHYNHNNVKSTFYHNLLFDLKIKC